MPDAALLELLAAAQIEPTDLPLIAGADPVLPTPYRVGTAGAAALAAFGKALASFGELRGLPPQRVAVDLRAAALSLRSARYLRINGAPLPPVWDPLSDFYPVRDGWIRAHCNFPNHRDAALKVLQAPPDRTQAAEKASAWTGEALEDAIHAAGGCAGFVRSAGDWQRHAQAEAVAAQPLIEITRIGEAPPEKPRAAKRPLAGIRVLDLTRVLAGPTCAKSLAEHGADVLKITAKHLPNIGYQEYDTGHGKLSAHLDLRAPGDLDILRGLVRKADVFSQGYRPGTLANRGLSPEELAAIRPGLVYVSLSAFGHAGPWASRRGFDTVVQTVSGITIRQAECFPGDAPGPQFYPVSAIDYCTGYLMAFGAMVALARRTQEGGSWLVRISLAQVGKWIVDLGEVPAAALKGIPAEFAASELERWSTVSETPSGRLRHLKPAAQLSETPPYWARPSVPLGYHRPVWP